MPLLVLISCSGYSPLLQHLTRPSLVQSTEKLPQPNSFYRVLIYLQLGSSRLHLARTLIGWCCRPNVTPPRVNGEKTPSTHAADSWSGWVGEVKAERRAE